MLKKILAVLTVFPFPFTLDGCDYSTIQEQGEAANAAWSEVPGQYRRRADLISNLVDTVKGYAKREDEVLTKVTKVHSRVGSIQMTAEDVINPKKLKRFQQMQNELGSALSHLLVVPENCPQLKTNQSFRDLQAQLEDTESHITLTRNDYIKSVQAYSTTTRRFPDNLTAKMFDLKQCTNFSVENRSAVSTAPEVSF